MTRGESDVDAAWAAGFFDGEGSVGCYQCGKYWRLSVSISQAHPYVLERFRKIALDGEISGPYNNGEGKSQVYHYKINIGVGVIELFKFLEPFLSPVKKKQFKQAISTYEQHYVIACVGRAGRTQAKPKEMV